MGLTKLHGVHSMHERKALMADVSVIATELPSGKRSAHIVLPITPQ
jgi:hypothetical protein